MPSLPPTVPYKRDRGKDNRPDSYARGYNNNWRKARLVILAEHPLCHFFKDCGNASEHVHHNNGIVSDLRKENLTGLCCSCHSKVTVGTLKIGG